MIADIVGRKAITMAMNMTEKKIDIIRQKIQKCTNNNSADLKTILKPSERQHFNTSMGAVNNMK